jgi:hypothetical protein
MLFAAPLRVDILDPQQKAPTMPPRKFSIQNRRKRMPAMQRAVGARREPENWRSLRVISGEGQHHGAQT